MIVYTKMWQTLERGRFDRLEILVRKVRNVLSVVQMDVK